MSVPKGKRGISEMEFFKLSNELYDTFEDWLLRDFGVRDKVRIAENESSPPEILKFPKWFIEHKRKKILAILDSYIDYIVTANTIYPSNYLELLHRRLNQDYALGKLEYLIQYLQRTLRSMPLSKTKNAFYFDMIEHTISIVKLWRKSDNRIKKILNNKFRKEIQEYRKTKDFTPLLGWGIPEKLFEKLILNEEDDEDEKEKGGEEEKKTRTR